MAKQPIPSVKADFANVMDLLIDWGIIPKSPPGNLKANAQRVHSATYSLILWRFRLRKLPQHGQVFLDEIASDALQILPQMLMGYGKTTTLLTRGIVENVLRHIYFTDHRVEFERMNREKKWFMHVDALLEYARLLPLLADTERQFEAINKLSSLYSDLSADVHGRTVRHLETRVALEEIRYDDTAGANHASSIKQCSEVVNYILAMFHREEVAKFQLEDRRIILRAMPAQARQVWNEYGA